MLNERGVEDKDCKVRIQSMEGEVEFQSEGHETMVADNEHKLKGVGVVEDSIHEVSIHKEDHDLLVFGFGFVKLLVNLRWRDPSLHLTRIRS